MSKPEGHRVDEMDLSNLITIKERAKELDMTHKAFYQSWIRYRRVPYAKIFNNKTRKWEILVEKGVRPPAGFQPGDRIHDSLTDETGTIEKVRGVNVYYKPSYPKASLNWTRVKFLSFIDQEV